MLDYGNFDFVCAPRVGVSWFLKACQLCGLGPSFPKEPKPHNGKFRVSLIRNPVSWLESIHAARRIGWDSVFLGKFRTLNVEANLEEYVWQYLQEIPGAIGELMLGYEADSILRIEDMPWGFLEFAAAVGIDPQFFPTIKMMGRTNASPFVLRMPKALANRVMVAEEVLSCDYEYLWI